MLLLGIRFKYKKSRTALDTGLKKVNFMAGSPLLSDPQHRKINHLYRADEAVLVRHLLSKINLSKEEQASIQRSALKLAKMMRQQQAKGHGLDAFMHEYDLSSQEGIQLMCLAESFLRIPDKHTADKLIADKITQADWEKHLGRSQSVFANASTWALMLTGKVLAFKNQADDFSARPLSTLLAELSEKLGDPLIRESVKQGMRIIARQFVRGRSIEEAVQYSRPQQQLGYTYSYDMLGEAAHTVNDAEAYFAAYQHAIRYLGKDRKGRSKDSDKVIDRPGISIKLSALHPRYEYSQRLRLFDTLLPRLEVLTKLAQQSHILLTIDAEEAHRLELSFDLLEALVRVVSKANWNGLGLALQAYQKRAYATIEWLDTLTKQYQCPLHIRLVKGAYWDTEIKRAQQLGLDGYPVFTRKVNTDISYLACAQRLLNTNTLIYPQFATHNAHTVASVKKMASSRPFEFQCLHGMGDSLYDPLLKNQKAVRCRIYAPVRSHNDLLPYLVRRLLENGANTSFVNRVQDKQLPLEKMVENPIQKISALEQISHPKIPLPKDLFQPRRENSQGLDLSDPATLFTLNEKINRLARKRYTAHSWVMGEKVKGEIHAVLNPANVDDQVGKAVYTDEARVVLATKAAVDASKE